MVSLDNINMRCDRIGDPFQSRADHMAPGMPFGQTEEHATRLGIVERGALARKVWKTQKAIRSRTYLLGIVHHDLIGIGAASAFTIDRIAIQLASQPCRQRTRSIGASADTVSSGDDERPGLQTGIVDHVVGKVDEVRRAPQLHHHVAGTKYPG